MKEYKTYETYVRTSKPGMANFLWALIQVDGKITDTYWDGSSGDNPAYCGAAVMIQIPQGSEEKFKELSKTYLQKPPEIQVD